MTTAPNTAIAIRASLKVDERKVLRRSTEAEPDTAYRVDQWIVLFAINFATHPADVNINDVGIWIEVYIPDLLQEHCARHDVTLVANQILQDLEFARQQWDFPAAAIHCPRHEIHFEVADAKHGLIRYDRTASRERLDARQQLGE